ncbi:MAG: cytochrome c nitrite reductase small subunit [Thermoguttaceae bacterium]|jgi:cytochrome c nitrite reductase small subunit|nr:cytochrome c nitrite reductase small subunit [Thermoguttaceae bacterium]
MGQRSRVLLTGFAAAAVAGSFLGAGGFTFHYGEGLSYFSKAPETCVNCHIMQPHYDTWLKSSHHATAACVDCHLPADLPHSLVSKADNGFFHSWAFTFQDFHEPIQIKPRNLRILEDNCIRCHQPVVAQMQAYSAPADPAERVSCMHCHDDVGHTSRPRLYAR